MGWVDIFYLTLVLCAFSGFAVALAFYSQQDLRFRTERQKAEERATAAKQEPQASATEISKAA